MFPLPIDLIFIVSCEFRSRHTNRVPQGDAKRILRFDLMVIGAWRFLPNGHLETGLEKLRSCEVLGRSPGSRHFRAAHNWCGTRARSWCAPIVMLMTTPTLHIPFLRTPPKSFGFFELSEFFGFFGLPPDSEDCEKEKEGNVRQRLMLITSLITDGFCPRDNRGNCNNCTHSEYVNINRSQRKYWITES